MPLPKPGHGEGKDDFVSRCMSNPVMQREYPENDQRLAICFGQYRGKDMNDRLLEAIRLRQQKQSAFGYGILTADKYVETIRDCVGIDACYKFAATKSTSFSDILKKAAQTLVYCNEDMVLEENGIEFSKGVGSSPKKYDDIELPKNTLMVFRHILTTPRKDRDGDILRTQGAVVDPKMLLLWQHVHTLPIGKMLSVQEHNSKKLSIVSCIVDMNELSHDAAVMIDNKMGRFSHGFRALEFDEMKAEGGHEGGFDVKRFEVMEESLVSVPSNVDADVQEVMLSLVEGGKLTSPLMKATGKSIREKRNIHVPITVDLKMLINGKEVTNEDKSGSGSKPPKGEGCGCGKHGEECTCRTPKEADVTTEKEGTANDTEVKGDEPFLQDMWSIDAKCPKCGGDIGKDGKCVKCGYGAVTLVGNTAKALENLKPSEGGKCPECGGVMKDKKCTKCGYVGKAYSGGEKSGRMLSERNHATINGVVDDMQHLMEKGYDMNRGGHAIVKNCHAQLKGMLDANTKPDPNDNYETDLPSGGGVEQRNMNMTMPEAMALVLNGANAQQRSHLVEVLKALETADEQMRQVEKYHELIGVK